MSQESTSPTQDLEEVFTKWAIDQGIKVHDAIKAAQLPGKGIGVIATKSIKKGETLIELPTSALLTIDSHIVKAAKIPKEVTVHGTLAAALTLNHDSTDRKYEVWEATWPTRSDFESSLPLAWNSDLHELLPEAIKDLLKKQQRKFGIDWDQLRPILSEAKFECFSYYWMLVNSRCYYWPYAKSRKGTGKIKRLPVDDCMALCPFADYFNHASEGCEFSWKPSRCTLTSDRDYKPGEEVVVSYGAHSNDFLLVEYGFILASNSHDNLKLDHLILPSLSKKKSALLEELNFLGDYALHEFGTCYRTEVALRALLLSEAHVRHYVAGEDDGQKDQALVDVERIKTLKEFQAEIEEMLNSLLGMGTSRPLELIRGRWEQMKQFLAASDVWKDTLE